MALYGSGLIEGASSCHVTTDRSHLRPVFRARTSFTEHMAQLYLTKLQVLDSSSELETVRRFTEYCFFEKVGPQARTPPSMDDLTAMYKAKREEHSTWFTSVFPTMRALATILCVYIVYITLTPFHTFFRQPWHYCVRWKLPVKAVSNSQSLRYRLLAKDN